MKSFKNSYVIEIIESIRALSGRNDKIAELKLAMDTHPDFLKILQYTYNPYLNFYVSSVAKLQDSCPFRVLVGGYRTVGHAFPILDKLNAKGSAGASDKRLLAVMLEEMPARDIDVVDLILKRSLDCGISAASINKARPGTIPAFKVMLCEKFSKKVADGMQYPAFAQVKMDGLRILAFIKDNKVTLRTRSGKTIITHNKLDAALIALARGGDSVFDGELLVYKKGTTTGEYECRKTGNGIGNKAIRGTISEADADRLVFVVWDIISTDMFWAGKGTVQYKDRFSVLSSLLHAVHSDKLKLVESIMCDSYHEVQRYYEKQLALGQEGIILKSATGEYVGKRTKNCIKFKVENTADLIIDEVIEGAGKFSGRLGSFRCSTSDSKLSVNVGSGFTDSERITYFSNSMVGQIVEVKYNEIITDKFSDPSLFLPIFTAVRKDKSTANSLLELI